VIKVVLVVADDVASPRTRRRRRVIMRRALCSPLESANRSDFRTSETDEENANA
jgi:hypothetical protein